MRVSVGIDIAKEVHWVTAIDEHGESRLDHRLDNTPAAIEALLGELRALEGEITIGLDVIGGIAGLAEAMLAAAGYRLVHVPGLAVNRARQGTTGGESKSDPRDARVIADQVRIRRDLRPIEAETELDLDIRLLVGRRRDLGHDQTRRIGAGCAICWWPSFPAWNGRWTTPPRGRCGWSPAMSPLPGCAPRGGAS
jgi:Transposase